MTKPRPLLGRPALRRIVALAVAAAPIAAFACSGGGLGTAVPLHPPVSTASASASSANVAPRPAPVSAVALGQFGEGTFGPRMVRMPVAPAGSAPSKAIVVSAPRSPSGRRWIATALDSEDRPLEGARHEVAEAPEDTTNWDVRSVGDGFVLAWTKPTDAGAQLLTVSLAADGSPRGVAAVVTRSGDELVALRIIPLSSTDASGAAALLTYGERSLPKGAVVASGTLFAIALDPAGRAITNTPTKLADKLTGWQVAPFASGGAQAVAAFVQRTVEPKAPVSTLTTAASVGGDDGPRAARVITLGASSKGIVASDAVTLTTTDTAISEIDVVAVSGSRALAVWGDRRELDVHLFSAAIDVAGGKPKLAGPARRAVPPRGDQSIVALLPASGGAIALWETIHPRPTHEARRRFEMVRLSHDGESTSNPRGIWFPYEDGEPEISLLADAAGTGEDVALLTYGAACMALDASAQVSCDAKDLRPFVARFTGPTLTLRQADLLDVGKVAGGTVLHAFDLSCTVAKCQALVEGPGDPVTIALASMPATTTVPKGALWKYTEVIDVAQNPPRLETATTLGRESQFAGMHATRAGTGTMIGWITYVSDDDGSEVSPPPSLPGDKNDKKKGAEKKKPAKKTDTGARVAVRMLDAAGEPLGPISVVSERGLSKGDVAIAFSAEGGSGLVAYVSRAEGDEEVYVARVDATGKKLGSSTRITHAPGAASDVALTALPAPDLGYLLAWVDARKTAPAVYAVRIDKSGQKMGTEVKIGAGIAGDVSDVALAVTGTGSAGPRVVAVWSDTRDDATSGYGDIWVTTLSGKDPSKPLIAEKQLLKTKLHSHNPTVVARGDGGAVIAWMEDDPSASEMLELSGRAEWGTYWARIDATGTVVQPPTLVPVDATLGKGVVSGVALDCIAGGACHLALAWSDREGIALLGSTLTGTAASAARSVWSYHGAPTQEVAPALIGTGAYLCEDGLEKDDGRVRRLSIGW